MSTSEQRNVVEVEAAAVPRHTLLSLLCNLLLAAFYSLFVIAHFTVEREIDWTYTFPVLLQQSILVLSFLTRRPSIATSHRTLDWIVAMSGTLLPMLLRPTEIGGAYDWIGRPLMVGGIVLSIASLLSLGRSMAVVPGNRGLKTGGAYRYIRHPIYASYALTFTGYLLVFPSGRNAAVVAGALLLIGGRIVLEERFLRQDAQYRDYCERVRWRVLPWVF